MVKLTRKNAATAAKKRVRISTHCGVSMHPTNGRRHRHLVKTNVVFTANVGVPHYYRPVNRSSSLDLDLLSDFHPGEYEGLSDPDDDDDDILPAEEPPRQLFPASAVNVDGPSDQPLHDDKQHEHSNPDQSPPPIQDDLQQPPNDSSSSHRMDKSQPGDESPPLPPSSPPVPLSSSPAIPLSSPQHPLLPLASSSPTPPSPAECSSTWKSHGSIWSDPQEVYEAMSPRSYYLSQLPQAATMDALRELKLGKLREHHLNKTD